ncbi:serine protease [Corynebacterium sp. ACRQP]|uniref:S1 family peptidase n=1 Tax=Corynebacterium sp. ACRQP TaxID=2918195 RepID=UPI001EF4B71A|nr:serine protease [Corynebacterium sp. ACRQP]
MLPALNRTVARLSTLGGYCSGALIAPDIVLTCAHFFRERPLAGTQVRIDGSVFPVDSLHLVPGTDVALVRLPERIDVAPFVLGPSPRLLSRTLTLGFGGQARSVQARPGVYLGTLPVSWSRKRVTRVRPAGLVYANPPAVKGDSGGPVLVGGKVVGVQSLILDPRGINLRIATVSLWPRGLIQPLRRL